MADDATAKQTSWRARMLTFPRRISRSAAWSWLTFVTLLCLVAVVWVTFLTGSGNVRDALTWPRIVTVLMLVAIIPVVLYRCLKLWLDGEQSRFSDIDYAWEAGLAALASHGLKLEEAPLFLVLGSGSERQERALIRATGQEYRIRSVPEGTAPLHWYASPQGVFLFCSDASWLAGIAALAEKKPVRTEALPLPMAPAPPTIAPPQFSPPPPTQVAPAPASSPRGVTPPYAPNRGTVMLDQFLASQASSDAPPVAPPQPSSAPPKPPDAGPGRVETGPGTVLTLLSPIPGSEDVVAVLPTAQATERLQRLQYVCQLLRHARRPLCAINGILTLLPFRLVQGDPAELEELERAVKSDLLTIQRDLQLRCPVTVLVVGLEKELGFSELVRRVGPERAATQRFGRKFEVRSVPSREPLAAFSDHVCGAFEDWVHTLFREHQALARPGNTRLYELLCTVRCRLKTRLTEILAGGFGYDARELPYDAPFLFSGCYFAATGDTPDRQAFVKGVVDKLIDEQELVDWTQAALATNRRYGWASFAGFFVSGVLLITLGMMLLDLAL